MIKKFWRFITAKDIEDQIEESIKKGIRDHTEFLLSLDERQLKYYNEMHGKGRIKWDVIRLEKRVFELEQKLNRD